MENQLIDYLINEGFADSESSALVILDVISESFYEQLLWEVVGDADYRAQRRAENQRNRQRLGTTGRTDVERRNVAQTGSTRLTATRTRGGYAATTGMTGVGGAEIVRPSQGRYMDRQTALEREATNSLAAQRSSENPRTPTDFSTHVRFDPKTGKPIGRSKLKSQSPESDITLTIRDHPKAGQTPIQQVDPTADILRARLADRGGIIGSSRPQTKKPQQSQPQSETPAGRVTRLARSGPSETSRTTRTQQSQTRRTQPKPQTGTRGNPNNPNRIMGIQRQNPNK